MSVFLQNGVYWYEFTVKHQRYRRSSRSSDRDTAKQIELEHRHLIQLGTGGVSPTLQTILEREKEQLQGVEIPKGEMRFGEILPDLPEPTKGELYPPQPFPSDEMSLREAGEIYVRNRSSKRKPKTLECDVNALRNLLRFFGNIKLREFHIGHFQHYQKRRSKKACASAINHELGLLSRLLRQASLWSPIRDRYSLLPTGGWKKPKIFTEDEQEKLFKRLNSDPNLELASIVFTITRNTTASGCELRGLRLQHLELASDPPRVHIPPDSTKNNIRPRVIPLNGEALSAFKLAVARAKKQGSRHPDHYLFPYRIDRIRWDPTKPASKSWLRKQTEQLRKLTGIKHINPHVFRHLAVTELLENGAPEHTVIAIAGWASRKMIETYSHTRITAKAEAVNLLDGSGQKPPPPVAPAVPITPDVMQPAIQAEIVRQVALALQQHNSAPPDVSQPSLRLLTFSNVR